MVTRQLTVAVAVASTTLLASCQNTREGLEKDAERAAPKIERAAEQTAQAARQVGRDIAEAAGPAVQATKEGAAEVARGVDAAQQGAQVKAALMADASIDSTTIDVETDADTRTIVLKGRVRSAAEKAQAGRIAAAKAPGYRLDNELTVPR